MAEHRYKPLREQVMVITGATSGVGLATARRAARLGARLVIAARHEAALVRTVAGLQRLGADAVHVVADVGDETQVQTIALTAMRRFGGFDTWANNAGVVIFGRLGELPAADHQRLFLTNYWGTVYGSQVAVSHFRGRETGGTLINMASINADMPVPILGAYSASKAAVQAFTEALRMELLEEGAPVRVSLIKPAGLATPISEHGRSHLSTRGRVMPPMYDVELAVDAILAAARQPVREVVVGGAGVVSTLAARGAPALADRVFGRLLPQLQSSGRPLPAQDNLFTPTSDGEVYRDGKPQGVPFSPWTSARLRSGPLMAAAQLAAAAGVVAGAAAGAVLGRLRAGGESGSRAPTRGDGLPRVDP